MKEWSVSDEQFILLVKESTSLIALVRFLGFKGGGGYYKVKSKIIELQLDVSHFTGQAWNRNGEKIVKRKREREANNNWSIKKKLLKEGLLINQCVKCGLGPEWMNEPITLQMDHINGVNTDNRIENLRIMCPNCHSQTSTFGNRNKTNLKKKNRKCPNCDIDIANTSTLCGTCRLKEKFNNFIDAEIKSGKCINCNKEVGYKSTRCNSCNSKTYNNDSKFKPRIAWPSLSELLTMKETMTYKQIASLLNAHPTTVRHYIKNKW